MENGKSELMRKSCKRRIRTTGNLRLACCPWKITAVYYPLDRILHQIESDGTVDVIQGKAVFNECMRGEWYEMAPAMEGIIEFHELANSRHGHKADTSGISRLAKKLEYASPIFESDIEAAKKSIDSCKREALKLTLDQAQDILDTVRISSELEKLKEAA